MSTFEMAKSNYERGVWTIEMLRALVAKSLITEEQLEMIITPGLLI